MKQDYFKQALLVSKEWPMLRTAAPTTQDGRFMWTGKVDDPLRGWPFKCYLYWGLHHSSFERWNLSSVSSLSQFPNLSMHQNTWSTLNRWIQQTWDRIQELANFLKSPGSGLTKPWESCHWFSWPCNTIHHLFLSFLQGRCFGETVETFQRSTALSAPDEGLLPKSQTMWQLLAAGDIVFLKRKRGASGVCYQPKEHEDPSFATSTIVVKEVTTQSSHKCGPH